MELAEIRGCGIGYEVVGNGQVPLVLLNGVGMTMGHWNQTIELLNAGDAADGTEPYRVLLHDFRGQLMSERPDDGYSLELHSADLAELMDLTGIPAAHIAGTSYGSEVAMEFALAYPERCLSLTVIDGVSELDPVLTTAVESWIAATVDPRVFYRSLIPWNYSAGYLERNLAKLREREELIAGLPPDYFQGFVRLCEAFMEIDLTGRLSAVSCPTLVLVGECDILKHRGFAEIIRDAIPGARFQVIPGAGHAAVIEDPQAIADVLGQFLSSPG